MHAIKALGPSHSRFLLIMTAIGVMISLLGSPPPRAAATELVNHNRVLVFGSRDNGFEGNNMATSLKRLGLQVDRRDDLPSDLTPFASIWYVEAYEGLTTDEATRLAEYVRLGRGLYLTGERPCCEALNRTVEDLLRDVLLDQGVTVGGMGDINGPFTFQTSVTDYVATTPNQLWDFVPQSPGGMAGLGDVDSLNVFASSATTPVGAVWPEKSMKNGRGRIAILMDIDWLGRDTREPIIENLANFLLGGWLCYGSDQGFSWTGPANCTSVLSPGTYTWTVETPTTNATATVEQPGVTATCDVSHEGRVMTVSCPITAVSDNTAMLRIKVADGDRQSLRFVHVVAKNDERNLPPGQAANSNWWDWPDGDEDGIPDYWETHGVWVNGEYANLPGMGLDPDRKDLILTMDYEEGQKPDFLTRQALIDMFRASPLSSGDTSGVKLHFQVGRSVPASIVGNFHLDANSLVRVLTYTGFNTNPLAGGPGVPQLSKWLINLESGVSGRDYICADVKASGCAGLKGGTGWVAQDLDGFLAALGLNLPSWEEEGRTYAKALVTAVIAGHELGHLLGLRHHGAVDEPADSDEYKSIMSYAYSTFGLPSDGLFAMPHPDYSREQKVNLDWEMGRDDGKLTFVRGQHGEVSDFYEANAGNARWSGEDANLPIEPDPEEVLRDADPATLAEFFAAAKVPFDYQAPSLPDGTASVAAGGTVDVELRGEDPMGPVSYEIIEQSPLGSAVPTPTGIRFTASKESSGEATLVVRAIGTVFGSNWATVRIEITPGDVTPPTIKWDPSDIRPGAKFDFGSVPAAPTCTASDAESGVNHEGCVVTGYETSVGVHTITASATDVAGNTATAAIAYEVRAWTLSQFARPIRPDQTVVNAGATLPVAFSVTAASGKLLTDPASIGAVVTVQPLDAVTGEVGGDASEVESAGKTQLRFDEETERFVFNWKTRGLSPGTYRLAVLLADGSTRSAHIVLR